ncbi:hypothetical protein [Umezakia ovalisporum]|uniref:Nif11 domain-containing protein n=2 Tax=Umezakia ovalisporum TaxID=75695 RepID=A0AA43GXR0_9CYAN|nr:hypothetical protein [Umezakia ovalisporum]MDH6057373.1 hypothetical protein [Umezakia ovalisporum FSS-43]MDH6063562.1 hypothetical protein [Umezakia ovalisporum FSS-62]MDH6065991.1 hypothetical protein [Umezakia ovalisporum APH033B]MDH6072487.1 hypothetical protein [Umezakia ovalisporum CobakiLakeA]MDH6075552.1 hypothetical protein [Umezakia ovalisporum CS-1034]
MSLEQVDAFYQILMSDQAIYEQYCNECCCCGFFGSFHWSKTKIVNFAANLGFYFTEYELEELWFKSQPNMDIKAVFLSSDQKDTFPNRERVSVIN